MTLNQNETRQLQLVRALAQVAVRTLEPHPLGHAYFWGNYTFRRALKNGKVKVFRVKQLLACVCVLDLAEAQRRIEAIPGVTGVYYNLD